MAILSKKKKINGLRLDELNACIGDLEKDAEMGKYKFHAITKWVKGAHCETVLKDFIAAGKADNSRYRTHIIQADEPTTMLGKDKGPNATEALLGALGSCLTVSFIFQAAAQNIKIDSLEFDMEGQLDLRGFAGVDKTVRNGFESICVVCRVEADTPRKKLEELCHAAQDRSPVFDMITHPTPVYIKLETIE